MSEDIVFLIFQTGRFENGDPAYFIGSTQVLDMGIDDKYCYGNVEERDMCYLMQELSEQVYEDLGRNSVFKFIKASEVKYMITEE